MAATNRQPQQQQSSSSSSRQSSSLLSKQQQRIIAPSSLIANQSENIPTPECCCFSARFVNLILYLFNFIFLFSGICILLLTVLYGRPEVSRYLGETTKYLQNIINLMDNGHLVHIIHYTMLFCGIVIIVISLINICFATTINWSNSSDYYYYHRDHHQYHHGENRGCCYHQKQQQQQRLNENKSLLRYGDGNGHNHNGILLTDSNRQQQEPSSLFISTSSTSSPSKSAYLNESLLLDDSNDLDLCIDDHGHRYSSSTSSSSTTDQQQQQSSSMMMIMIDNDGKYSNQILHNNNNNNQIDDYNKMDRSKMKHSNRKKHSKSSSTSSWSHFANSTLILCIYIFILLFLFTIQLVIGLISIITVSPDNVFISSSSTSSKSSIQNDNFLISIRDSINIANLLVNRANEIEQLYQEFHCCGWNYYDDYEYLRIIDNNQNDDQQQQSTIIIDDNRNKTIPVPDLCCKTLIPNCGRRKHPNNIYYDGCWSKFGTEMRDYILMLGWTALGFAIIELIGLMFAVCHYVQIMSKS
ncbi:uncharacterized protein LOC113788758 [Dermatophagoides pteronyssinus]|uniref:uncharacterized protein LOC113788758 n=1 Tax=Dermatophagoides pteronyssinus TaxID=6956 RepID=UPI003F6790F0